MCDVLVNTLKHSAKIKDPIVVSWFCSRIGYRGFARSSISAAVRGPKCMNMTQFCWNTGYFEWNKPEKPLQSRSIGFLHYFNRIAEHKSYELNLVMRNLRPFDTYLGVIFVDLRL